jgi:predicted lipoprotein with Yx(FWY)xxD motif
MSRTSLAAITAVLVAGASVAAQAATKPVTLKSESATGISTNVLAASNGRTLYRLKPETTHHLLCTSSACLQFWPPLTVKSKSTKVKLPKGIKGKIGYLKRGKRWQVTLGGKPLYMYGGDSGKGEANGQNIKTFGGTWLVLAVKSTNTQNTAPPMPNVAPPPPPPPGPPSPPPYPPYY